MTLLCCAQLASLGACVSLKSAHQRFIEWADGKVALAKTIQQLDYDPAYPLGLYLADYHSLTNIQVRPDGRSIYHYAKPMLTGKYTCHFHLIADSASTVVIGWGFDLEISDPKKNCGIAG